MPRLRTLPTPDYSRLMTLATRIVAQELRQVGHEAKVQKRLALDLAMLLRLRKEDRDIRDSERKEGLPSEAKDCCAPTERVEASKSPLREQGASEEGTRTG